MQSVIGAHKKVIKYKTAARIRAAVLLFFGNGRSAVGALGMRSLIGIFCAAVRADGGVHRFGQSGVFVEF